MRIAWAVGLVGLGAVLGCSGGDDGAPDGPLEQWGQAPESPPAGARRIELDETIVPPYADQQTCFYQPQEAADGFLAHFDGYQGEGGHHVLLFRSLFPKPAGTIEDCSNPESMATLIPVISQSAELPPGMAIRVAAGTQLVVQSHYVNTTERELRVHDVADVTFLPAGDVGTVAGFFANTDVSFHLPAGQQSTVSVRCTAPWDMNVLRISPHMHEHGARFQTHVDRGAIDGDPVGDATEPELVVDVPAWEPFMRDIAPAVQWGREDALALHAGDQFVTDCTFTNDTDGELTFPREMCAISGYFFPALEGQSSWICDGGENLDD